MGIKINKEVVGKVFGVIAGVAGVISTVDTFYSGHKEKQDSKTYKDKVDALEKTVEELLNK